jgi:hypothetical protein
MSYLRRYFISQQFSEGLVQFIHEVAEVSRLHHLNFTYNISCALKVSVKINKNI